jgi:hypothetical protein
MCHSETCGGNCQALPRKGISKGKGKGKVKVKVKVK